jgi:hypothetical protein
VFFECVAFFSSAGVFYFSEEFLFHGYTYVMLHDCKPIILCIIGILKSLIGFIQQKEPRENHENPTINDDAHQKLTGMLGEITAQTMKMQTYTNAIENMLAL